MLLQLKAFTALAEKVSLRNPGIPILKQVCIDNGTIRITDLENTLVMPLDDARSYCIPLEVLKQVFRANPSEIKISLLEDNQAEIMFDLHSVVCPTLLADEYPALPNGDFSPLGTWTKAVIAILHKQLQFASNDELKPALTGIRMSQNGTLQSCASDGHVLQYVDDLDAQRQCHLEGSFDGILARKTVTLLSQIPVGKITVAYKRESPACLRFDLPGAMVLYARLIEEQFPDFASILAEAKANSVRVKRQELLEALRIAGKFTNKANRQGILKVQNGLLALSTTDAERNLAFATHIPTIERLGAEMQIGFNLRLLEQVIDTLPEPEILWRYSSPVTANLFTGMGNPNVQNLLMPIRLEEE